MTNLVAHVLSPPVRLFVLHKPASFTTSLLRIRLGYTIALHKSHLLPAPTISVLGFIIDTQNMCFRITDKRLLDLESIVSTLSSSPLLSLYSFQRFAGKAISISQAVPNARLCLNATYSLIGSALHTHSDSVSPTETFLSELNFWSDVRTFNGQRKWWPERHLCLSLPLFTDASGTRWGATLLLNGLQHEFAGDFPDDIRASVPPSYINVLEMWAVVLALKSTFNLFDDLFHDVRLDLAIDNTTSLYALLTQGTKNLRLLPPP